MSRLYRFEFDKSIPSDVAADFPEGLDAGPATISAKIGEFVRANPTFEITEDPDDYVLHVQPAKPESERARHR